MSQVGCSRKKYIFGLNRKEQDQAPAGVQTAVQCRTDTQTSLRTAQAILYKRHVQGQHRLLENMQTRPGAAQAAVNQARPGKALADRHTSRGSIDCCRTNTVERRHKSTSEQVHPEATGAAVGQTRSKAAYRLL